MSEELCSMDDVAQTRMSPLPTRYSKRNHRCLCFGIWEWMTRYSLSVILEKSTKIK